MKDYMASLTKRDKTKYVCKMYDFGQFNIWNCSIREQVSSEVAEKLALGLGLTKA